MEKSKTFEGTKFSPSIILEASRLLSDVLDPQGKESPRFYLTADLALEKWEHENEEEFFADYLKPNLVSASYSKSYNKGKLRISCNLKYGDSSITVEAPER